MRHWYRIEMEVSEPRDEDGETCFEIDTTHKLYYKPLTSSHQMGDIRYTEDDECLSYDPDDGVGNPGDDDSVLQQCYDEGGEYLDDYQRCCLVATTGHEICWEWP